MQRERDFEEFKYFLSPSQRSFCTVTDQQTDTPPTHPRQSKKARCLENENEAKSRCQGDAKKCAIGVLQSLSRATFQSWSWKM